VQKQWSLKSEELVSKVHLIVQPTTREQPEYSKKLKGAIDGEIEI